MSNGIKKRMKEIVAIVEGCGFILRDMTITKGDHICCHITDDNGNKFKAFTGQSCSGNTRMARLNFRQDIRRISHRKKLHQCN